MYINEVEAFLKMTRAQIRFYEQAGLLSPSKSPSTYGDYSEEDLDTLQKIMLLRMLRIPVDTIRKLQTGALQLNQVISDKLQQLKVYLADHSEADEICRSILEDNAGYAGLDAKRYLTIINGLPKSSAWFFSLPDDEQPKVNHPWRRYFARSLDISIYSLIWCAIGQLALRWNPTVSFPARILEIYIPLAMMLIIEPILLSSFGTTPGKLIFGLRVEGTNSNKPTFGQALERTWTVFGSGTGYNIPFYNLYRLYKSYKACKENDPLKWDDPLPYTISDTKGVRILILIVSMAVVFTLNLLIIFQARMPIHRGEITAAEFVDNVNDLIDFYGINYGQHLNSSGQWVDDPQNGTSFTIMPFVSQTTDYELVETDGILTKVGFTIDRNDAEWVVSSNNMMYLSAIAFLGAQEEINCLDILTGEFATIQNSGFNSFIFTKAGIHVTYHVEYSGYSEPGSSILIPNDNGTQYYHAAFSMQKT